MAPDGSAMIWLSTVCPIEVRCANGSPDREAEQHRPEDHTEQQLRPLGPFHPWLLESGTPLAIASTPVSALQPAEKPSEREDPDRCEPVRRQHR